MSKKEKKKEEEAIDCVWDMGTPCDDGERREVLMFDKQLKIPICNKHVEEHREVMTLHANGYDIEEIVDMSPEERKHLVLTMTLSGLKSKDVEL